MSREKVNVIANLERKKFLVRPIFEEEKRELGLKLAITVDRIEQLRREKVVLKKRYAELNEDIDRDLDAQLAEQERLKNALLFNFEEIEETGPMRLGTAMIMDDEKASANTIVD